MNSVGSNNFNEKVESLKVHYAETGYNSDTNETDPAKLAQFNKFNALASKVLQWSERKRWPNEYLYTLRVEEPSRLERLNRIFFKAINFLLCGCFMFQTVMQIRQGKEREKETELQQDVQEWEKVIRDGVGRFVPGESEQFIDYMNRNMEPTLSKRLERINNSMVQGVTVLSPEAIEDYKSTFCGK